MSDIEDFETFDAWLAANPGARPVSVALAEAKAILEEYAPERLREYGL